MKAIRNALPDSRHRIASVGLLKAANVVDVPQWRFIQHLGAIRNLCDHNKAMEPTAEQVTDLITGVDKTLKTLF